VYPGASVAAEVTMIGGVVLAICSSICYGLGPVIYKLGFSSGLEPSDLLTARFVVATPILFLYYRWRKGRFPACSPGTLGRAALLSCLFYAPQTASFAQALRYIPAATNTLILYFYPLTVTLVSALFLGFRLDRTVAAALVCVMAGVGCVSADAVQGGLDVRGLGFALLTMACYSGYLLALQRFLAREEPLAFTCWVLVCMTGLYGLFKSPLAMLDYGAEQLVWAVSAGVFPTALAVPLLYLAIERIGSAYVSIFSTFELVATLVTAALILGEPVTLFQVAGMATIMAGVALPNLAMARRTGRPVG
jgi:drug/metabolite transporter (DMT)-like permease